MKKLSLILLSFICINTSAQESIAYAYVDNGDMASYVFDHQTNSIAKVFVDSTKVRELPTLSAETVDILPQNKSIKIIEDTKAVTKLGERYATWYRVSYDGKTGFVWSGNLAIASKKLNDVEFLFGLPTTQKIINPDNTSEEKIIASIKYFKNNQFVDEKSFDAGNRDNLTGQFLEVKKSQNLKNVNYIINALVSGESCGIPTYEQNFLVKNDQLVLLPKTISVSDAGVFYHSEKIELHSKENKLKESFLFINEEAESIDDTHEKLKGSKITSTYSWDGDNYTLLKSKKEAIQ